MASKDKASLINANAKATKDETILIQVNGVPVDTVLIDRGSLPITGARKLLKLRKPLTARRFRKTTINIPAEFLAIVKGMTLQTKSSSQGNKVKLSQPMLEQLRLLFSRAQKEFHLPVSLEVFTLMLESCGIEKEAASRLFATIDWPAAGLISWDELCTYLYLELTQEEYMLMRACRVELYEPPIRKNLPHRDPAIALARVHDGFWVICSQMGTLTLWSSTLKVVRQAFCVSESRNCNRLAKKWITGMVLMPEYSKVILTTGDREIQFFDSSSFRPFCQLSGLRTQPMAVHYGSLGEGKCIIVYGDQAGCVSVLTFKKMGSSFRYWHKAPLYEGFIPSVLLDHAVEEERIDFTCWHVHNDWVDMVRYYPETDQVVSCSSDINASLVIGRRRASTNVQQAMGEQPSRTKFLEANAVPQPRAPHDQLVFGVFLGVSCFDFNYEMKIVATGGTDHHIRLWNCYFTKSPIATLRGHYTPIFYLIICGNTKRLYSVSKDKWVKVWDVVQHTCIQTLPWHVLHLTGELNAVAFSCESGSLALVGENMVKLKLRARKDVKERFVKSHDSPVTCCCYSEALKQVITACEGSVVKTWNLETGLLESEFRDAHDSQGVASMTLDPLGRRLITVGRDGTGRIWNHNNGQRLNELQPHGRSAPLTTVTYVDIYKEGFILTAGWNRRINVYHDDIDSNTFILPLIPNFTKDVAKKGHREDVLCSDFCPPKWIATGGFDGLVMIWDKEKSQRDFVLCAPLPPDLEPENEQDKGVNCLAFLKQRVKRRLPGTLVVGGPYGYVHIWDAIYKASLVAQFGLKRQGPQDFTVTAVGSDVDNKILAVGDSQGHITVYTLDHCIMRRTEGGPPPELACWEAHLKAVTDLKAVLEHPYLVSCSVDGCVRLWTIQGHLIGTFGQRQLWDLKDESTFRHPRIPSDIWDAFYEIEFQNSEETKAEECLKTEATVGSRGPFTTIYRSTFPQQKVNEQSRQANRNCSEGHKRCRTADRVCNVLQSDLDCDTMLA
ncbi:hypothetical protein C0Q70_05820 [Pomacea canaliculata]|uniref:Uncharacterized protein n=1 Tax=Pomacea canaliculata TaxID=400727 RepID=A0A2T7PM99_POMCA|nr:hypothetical protein C0Q70_05820 [Pomacea canaliculata]